MKEVWKDIPNLKEYDTYYEISNKGVIKRKSHSRKCRNQHKEYIKHYSEKIMKTSRDSGGYEIITICSKYTLKVHRVLATLFIHNDDPINKTQVNHKNGIKDDNRLSNLEWSTPSNNYQHAFNNELNYGPLGESNGNSKLCKDDVLTIKWLLENSKTKQKDIAEQFGVGKMVITDIKKGRTWSHVTGHKYQGRIKKFKGKVRKYE